MTLIITTISDNAVVQVSDRRLTFIDGSLCDDLAIKAICISCTDASFCMAYTGLALVGSQRTDEWGVDYLTSINAGELGFVELFESFKKHLASTFKKLRQPAHIRGITFVFAGFGRPGPFMGRLSNMEDEKGNRLSGVDDEFHAGFYFRNDKPMRKLDVMINGAEKVVETFEMFIPIIRKRYFGKSSDRIATILVQLVRKAADHPTAGYLVGRNCMSSVVRPSGDFVCQDYPEKASPQQYLPHLIMHSTAYKGIRIWTGVGVPSWWSGNKD